MAGEVKVFTQMDKWQKIVGGTSDSIPDDVLLVNVCYDKVQVPYYVDGMQVGTITATDRQKLLSMLQAMKEAQTYRYVMLDVNFERGISTPYDSALFRCIEDMPRIVIPQHSDCLMADSALLAKSAYADFSTTYKAQNFSRFQYLQEGTESMPLRMYADLDGGHISKWGPIYTHGGRLCRNGVSLRLPVHMAGEYSADPELMRKNFLYLGVDLVDIDSIVPIAEQTAGKIVVVGDFLSDCHNTYVGPQPGSIICVNAYYALKGGEHLINWWAELLILLIYATMAWLVIRGISIKVRVTHTWLKVGLLIFGVDAVFCTITIVAYVSFNYMFNAVIPATCYSLLVLALNIYRTINAQRAK